MSAENIPARARGAYAKAAKQRETKIQAAIVGYLRAVLVDCLVWHTPNGGYRTPTEARRLIDMGVLPGVLDVQILAPMGRCYFIEVKREDGTLEPSQEAFIAFCMNRGVPYCIARSIDDVKTAVRAWGLRSREAV
jgi:hypothetical protein